MPTLQFANSADPMTTFFERQEASFSSISVRGLGSTRNSSSSIPNPGTVFGTAGIPENTCTTTWGTTAFIYVYKGEVPSSFESFSGNQASRNSDLLLILPKLGNNISQSSSTGTRFKVSTSNLSPVYAFTSPNVSIYGNISRVNNVCTMSANFQTLGSQIIASMAPNLTITISGSTDTTFNGNFVLVTANSNSTHSIITWNNTGTNANSSTGTISYEPKGIANGTATWFLIKSIINQSSGAVADQRDSKGVIDGNLLSTVAPTAVIGNIGVTGSGSDLEMNSTSIVANARYNSLGFYINFPYTWDIT